MPSRRWTVPALFMIIAVSVIMIFSGSLSGAAAWANIFALPVAILGVIAALRGTGSAAPAKSKSSDGSSDVKPVVHQTGYALKGDQFNVAGDYIQDHFRSNGGSR